MEYTAEIINLYTTLFVIAITLVGILLASIIALTQLLEPFLVSKSAQKLVRPVTLSLSIQFLCVLAAATLAPTALLSMREHDYIKGIDFGVNDIFINQWYAASAILLLVVSVILVTAFIYRVSRYLVPVNALEFLRESLKTDAVTSYFGRSAATRPVKPFNIKTLLSEEDGVLTISQNDDNDEEAEKQYQADLKSYEASKEKLAKLENPLFPIEAYLTRSIQKGNITIVVNTLKTIESIIRELLVDDKFESTDELVRYYKTVLENAHELAQSIGLQSISIELLNSSSRVADIIIEKKKFSALNALLEYWKPLASDTIGANPSIFKHTVGIISETAQAVIRQEDVEWSKVETFTENVSRSLGWLGERLLEKNAPEKRAIMYDNYETEFGTLMNAVTGIGWDLHSRRADTYPLIYFDCLYVIARKLAIYVDSSDNSDNDISNSLFSLMYEVFSFGEAAIIAGNIKGAGLALLRLQEHCKIADDNSLEEHKRRTLDEIFRLGALAAGSEIEGLPDFLYGHGDNLAEAAIDFLREHSAGIDLSNEAREILIKASTNENHEKIREYLVQAGEALHSSFGMNLNRDN